MCRTSRYLFFFNVELQKAKSKAQISNNLKEEASLCNQLGELLAKNGEMGNHPRTPDIFSNGS